MPHKTFLADKRRAKTYYAWGDMKRRCNNPKTKDYPRYGGRGITYCKRWEKFTNFLADMGWAPAGKSLDRINNDGNYKPSNCRWATHLQQYSNKTRAMVFYEFNGERLCKSAWDKKYGGGRRVIYGRLTLGWGIKKALLTPIKPKRNYQRTE